MKVAIGDVDLDAGASAPRRSSAAAPSRCALDVTDRESFERFLDETERQLGPLDVLVNNAGIMQIGRFVDERRPHGARQIDINLHGVILGLKLALGASCRAAPATS